MPAINRSAGRNVHIYDAQKPDEKEELGGLILSNGVTNRNFYDMISIIFIIDGPYFLRHNDTVLPQDDAALQIGNYYVVTTSMFN